MPEDTQVGSFFIHALFGGILLFDFPFFVPFCKELLPSVLCCFSPLIYSLINRPEPGIQKKTDICWYFFGLMCFYSVGLMPTAVNARRMGACLAFLGLNNKI